MVLRDAMESRDALLAPHRQTRDKGIVWPDGSRVFSRAGYGRLRKITESAASPDFMSTASAALVLSMIATSVRVRLRKWS